jgi:hypothetical protein
MMKLTLLFLSSILLFSCKEKGCLLPENASDYSHQNMLGFKDIEKAKECAKLSKKPILIVFTGWACVGDRRTIYETHSSDIVQNIIKDKMIFLYQYVDEKTELPKEHRYISERGDSIITTGRKAMDFEINRFKTATQPLYVLTDESIKNEYGMFSYNPDSVAVATILSEGLEKYNADKAQSETK